VPALANDARERRLQPYLSDRLRQLGDDGRVIGADCVTEVDLVNRDEDMFGRADEGAPRFGACRATRRRWRGLWRE
jgi:hypothetical protein